MGVSVLGGINQLWKAFAEIVTHLYTTFRHSSVVALTSKVDMTSSNGVRELPASRYNLDTYFGRVRVYSILLES